MIIVLKPDHQEDDLHRLVRRLEDLGLHAHISKGEHRTIVGAIGDERMLRGSPPGIDARRGMSAAHPQALQAGQ